jgi:uncharacterized C2H2 Zn-finger protein
MKLYICRNCDAVFKSDPDAQTHRVNSAHKEFQEYELEDFLTRFLTHA